MVSECCYLLTSKIKKIEDSGLLCLLDEDSLSRVGDQSITGNSKTATFLDKDTGTRELKNPTAFLCPLSPVFLTALTSVFTCARTSPGDYVYLLLPSIGRVVCQKIGANVVHLCFRTSG